MSVILDVVEAHRALSHPLFQEMAKRKLSREYRALFFREMGEFCRKSRDFGILADQLEGWDFRGNKEAAAVIREIAESEAGHEEEFEAMAKALTENPAFSSTDGECLRATEKAAELFDLRMTESRVTVDACLGILVAVELLAHRHIIPGEVNAFVTSGHYGVNLDDPAMRYLKEHAGELGAEANHEKLVITHLASMGTGFFIIGAVEFLDDVAVWYDTLLQCLHETEDAA